MSALFKYAVVLASGLAVGVYVNRPMGLDEVMTLTRLDGIGKRVDDAFDRFRPKAAAADVDPTAAGRVDEDLDFLIAKQNATIEGWRAFLAAHVSGAHAAMAAAEVDKLSLLAKALKPAAEVTDSASPAAKPESEAAQSVPPPEGAAPPPHDVCNPDGKCPGEPRSDSPRDDLARATSEPAAGTARMQVASLTGGVDTAAAQPNPSARTDLRPRPRATAPHRGPAVSSHTAPAEHEHACASRFGCRSTAQTLPPILMALLGVKTKHSTKASGRPVASARPDGPQEC